MASIHIRKVDMKTKIDLKTPEVGRIQSDGGSISELDKPDRKLSGVENYELDSQLNYL